MWQIGIVEDDHTLLSALADFLNEQTGFRCALAVDGLGSLFETWNKEIRLDILLLDIILGKENSLDHLHKIKALLPKCKVIIMTGRQDTDFLIKALAEGADSYYLKGSDLNQLLNIIEITMNGGAYIDPYMAPELVDVIREKSGTEFPAAPLQRLNRLVERYELHEREMQVAKGLIIGQSYQEIGDDLNIALDTVRHYVKSLYKKLNINNKIHLIRKVNSSD